MHFSTNNSKETLVFGERLGKNLQAGDIIFLFGEIGSGKTTLTQGIGRGLGIGDKCIRSPTFTIINEYFGSLPVYHIDLYRLDTYSEIEALGLEEIFVSSGVSIIEWAEKLSSKCSKVLGLKVNKRIEIYISIERDNERIFRIELFNHRNCFKNL